MNIILNGFFDKNFGDDIMQLMAVRAMADDVFFVSCAQREMLAHFEGLKNVRINEACGEYNAYVNVIGTGFLYKGKRALAEKLIGIPFEKKISCKKRAVIDCSIVLPENRLEGLLMKREINKYNYISSRDSLSEEYFKKTAKNAEVVMHEDIVFSIGEEYICQSTGEGCLGVVPVQRSYSAENYSYYKTLAGECDRFCRESGKKVLIFAFDTGTENDTCAALSIKSMMKERDEAEIIAYNSDPKYIFENFARCGKIISSRFHGVIAAMTANIPVCAVYDTLKIKLLSEKYGFAAVEKTASPDALRAASERASAVRLPESVRADAAGHIAGLKEFLRG